MRLLGTRSHLVVLTLSAVCGTLIVGVVFAVARRWFGRAAAAAAALLLALCDFHVAFSRAGLTDPMFLLFLLLALWALSESDARGSRVAAVLGGIAAGLAWNTKYHGWLAIVIAGAALLPRLAGRDRAQAFPAAVRLALAAAIAAALYVPWFLYVESAAGGYALLAEQQAGFLQPWGVLSHPRRHAATQLYFDGWAGRTAVVAGFVLLVRPALLTGDSVARASAVLWSVALLLLSTVAGESGAATALAAVAVVSAVRHRSDAARMPLAFVAVFTVLTPLYLAYPRLLMPWLAAVFILAGAGLARIAAFARGEMPCPRFVRVGLPGLVVVACAGVLALRGLRPAANPWTPSRGFETASADIARLVPAGSRAVVVCEPAVVFYLRGLSVAAEHLDSTSQIAERVPAGEPFVLVSAMYERGAGSTSHWIEEHAEVTRAAGRVTVDFGDVPLLDNFDAAPARAMWKSGVHRYHLDVYLVTPSSSR
jgi:4-amino-4-deoxy-L-arabinose transferase-like glycosyltransferase